MTRSSLIPGHATAMSRAACATSRACWRAYHQEALPQLFHYRAENLTRSVWRRTLPLGQTPRLPRTTMLLRPPHPPPNSSNSNSGELLVAAHQARAMPREHRRLCLQLPRLLNLLSKEVLAVIWTTTFHPSSLIPTGSPPHPKRSRTCLPTPSCSRRCTTRQQSPTSILPQQNPLRARLRICCTGEVLLLTTLTVATLTARQSGWDRQAACLCWNDSK